MIFSQLAILDVDSAQLRLSGPSKAASAFVLVSAERSRAVRGRH